MERGNGYKWLEQSAIYLNTEGEGRGRVTAEDHLELNTIFIKGNKEFPLNDVCCLLAGCENNKRQKKHKI